MAKRNAGRRGRSRKRGGATAARTATGETPAAQAASATAAASPRRERARAGGATTPNPAARPHRDPGGVGPRPQAPWHPWPLSELLILVGAIGTIVGFAGQERAVLGASVVAVLIGTLDFTIREHLSGYRSHTVLLAAVPTALLHGALALGLFAVGVRGEALVLAPVIVDVPVFWLLYKLLRARFQDARRERVLALGGR